MRDHATDSPRPDVARPVAAHLSFGAAAETLVAEHYRRTGHEVLARNWRGSAGELDLVVRRDRTVVFVEVKARRRVGIDSPAVAVGPAKQRRLRATAAQWLAAAGAGAGLLVRFDVVAVAGEGQRRRIDVYTAAF